jgi:glycosyltransferase involved in cell wall biosynthesis
VPDRPLRVAFLNASLDIGGSERQMVALAERLPRDRFSPAFVLLTRRGPLADRAEAAGIPIRVLDWGRGHSPIQRAPDVARLAGALRTGRFDIVDAWLFHGYALASFTRPLSRVPVLVAGRRSLSDHKRAFGRADRLLDRVTRARADAIVANAEAVREEVAAYEGLDAEGIRVIHNGIEIRPPLDPAVRAAIRSGWDARPGEVVVGVVANYKRGKGLEMLLRAFAEVVRDAGPPVRLVLIGEGSLRPDLASVVRELGLGDCVVLAGAVPDAREIVGAFDVAVQSSESEGLPNAVLEAAAAGVAIVATDAGGTREILDGGRVGVLVPVRSEEALAAGMRRLVADELSRRELGELARAFVAEAFGMDRFVRETAELYEELAAAKGISR